MSSTYTDLLEERQEVIQALLELDCIPAGMELFPASDEDRWALIRQVIDDCDYYLVIVGGRYGSVDDEGVSYTEREYDYAVEVGRPVLAFLHSEPDQIVAGKTEHGEEAQEKLAAFRGKLEQRMCKYWRNAEELGGVVSRSLVKLMKSRPGEGWVRGRFAQSPEAIAELTELRAQVAGLEQERERPNEKPEDIAHLAQGDDPVELTYVLRYRDDKYTSLTERGQIVYTWDEIFGVVGPLMFDEAAERTWARRLTDHSMKSVDAPADMARLDSLNMESDDLQKVKVQLVATGLIEKSIRRRGVNDNNSYWRLTPYGEKHLMRLRAIRRDGEDDERAPAKTAKSDHSPKKMSKAKE